MKPSNLWLVLAFMAFGIASSEFKNGHHDNGWLFIICWVVCGICAVVAASVEKDVVSMQRMQIDIDLWQRKTFPGGTAMAQYRHLCREVLELGKNIEDPEEMADCVILLMGIASKAGVDLQEAVDVKMEINRKRRWGKPDQDGVVEHIEEGDAK